MGAPGPQKPIKTCRFLTFYLKFLKFQGDLPKNWRGAGPGRGRAGSRKSLKYIEDYNTFGLRSGGGRRALGRGNPLLFVGFYNILKILALEGPENEKGR